MERYTVEVVNALKANVIDNNDPLARQIKTEVKSIVVEAGGKLIRSDVMQGILFVTTDKKEAAQAVVARFSKFKGVVVREIDSLEALLRKSELRPVQQVEKKSAA